MVTYGFEDLKIMNLVEQLSGVTPKDVIFEEMRVTFLIPADSIARCIGKGGVVVKKLENLLKKKIRFIEYSTDLKQFIRNVVYPLELQDIVQDDAKITLHAANHQMRGLLIGRSAMNLRSTEMIVKRHFPISEIKVA